MGVQTYYANKLKSKRVIDFVEVRIVNCIDCQRLQRRVESITTTCYIDLQDDCKLTRTPSSMLKGRSRACVSMLLCSDHQHAG